MIIILLGSLSAIKIITNYQLIDILLFFWNWQ